MPAPDETDPTQEGTFRHSHRTQAPEATSAATPLALELPGRIAAEQANDSRILRDLKSKHLVQVLSELRRTNFARSNRPGVVKNAAALSLGFVSRRVPRGAVLLSAQTTDDSRRLVKSITKLLECSEFNMFQFTSM